VSIVASPSWLPLAGEQQAAPDEVSGSTVLVLVGLGLLVLWLLSLLLHPFTTCSSCNGSPRSYGAVATRSFRMCGSCGGTGRQLRIGARVWPQNRE
jgi:hypothetical protein